MTSFSNLLKRLNLDTDLPYDKSPEEMRVSYYNKSKGSLEGYNCKECNNRGDFMYTKDGIEYLKPCKCTRIRKNYKLVEKSGLGNMFERYSFETFVAASPWQKEAFDKARRFAENPDGWFFIGGQPGSGKTHLCTAIANELMQRGMEVKYMLWRDDSVKLKGSITEEKAYLELIMPLKDTKVLFIDDFFKATGKSPSPADVGIAYEILNYRYNNRHLITLISSEMLLDRICTTDAATGSRIVEMCSKYAIDIDPDPAKNYRMVYR